MEKFWVRRKMSAILVLAVMLWNPIFLYSKKKFMPEGPDHYASMTALYAHEVEGINFTKEWYRHRWRYETFKNYKEENEIFIMAPHGGGIESGTTELALATAGFTNDFNGQPATS